MLRSDGKITYIISLDLETLEVEEPTYNFEVEQDHDYYVGDSGVLVHNVGCSFENQFPHLLVGEIADAETAGIVPIRAVAPGFEQMVNQGTIKWVLTEKNELIVAPAMTNGFEISHAVLSKGRPVLSAGQADIAVVGKARVAAGITNKSGHFKPSKESLKLGIEAFRRKGISKPTLGLV